MGIFIQWAFVWQWHIKYHSYTNHRLNANNLEQNGPHCSTIPFTPHSNIHTGKQRESQTHRQKLGGTQLTKQTRWVGTVTSVGEEGVWSRVQKGFSAIDSVPFLGPGIRQQYLFCCGHP